MSNKQITFNELLEPKKLEIPGLRKLQKRLNQMIKLRRLPLIRFLKELPQDQKQELMESKNLLKKKLRL